MPQVSHHFVVDRPIDAVFDVVTTARFWPEWHPATRGVEGDIDHPARLGDKITEHVTIAGIQGSGTWSVVAPAVSCFQICASHAGDHRPRAAVTSAFVGEHLGGDEHREQRGRVGQQQARAPI